MAETVMAPLRRLVDLDTAARVVTLVLVAMLAWSLAQLTWRLVPVSVPESEVTPPAPPTATASSATRGPDAAVLTGAALFGRELPRAQRQAVAQQPKVAPKTTLNVKLLGILFSDNPELARAIIRQPGADRDHYRIGDALKGGAKLYAIYVDRVILDRRGRLETLSLDKEAADLGLTANDVDDRRGVAAGSAVTGSPATAELLRAYRQDFAESPMDMVQRFKSTPVRRGGRLVGFRLEGVQGESLLADIGIGAGDIITEVNGIALDEPANVPRLMEELRAADSLQLRLLRDGRRPASISIDLGA